VDIFFGFRSVDFVVFAADKEGCETKELEIFPGDGGTMEDQNEIDELDTDLKSLGLDAKLASDSSQPSDQDLPHV
jgi:hypothetical protein